MFSILSRKQIEDRLLEYIIDRVPVKSLASLAVEVAKLPPDSEGMVKFMWSMQQYVLSKETVWAMLMLSAPKGTPADWIVAGFLLAVQGTMEHYPMEQNDITCFKSLIRYSMQDSPYLMELLSSEDFDKKHYSAAMDLLDGSMGSLDELRSLVTYCGIRELEKDVLLLQVLYLGLALMVYGRDMLLTMKNRGENHVATGSGE